MFFKPFSHAGSFMTPAYGTRLRRVAIRGAGLLLSAETITYMVSLVSVSILARMLVPSDFGLVAIVTTFSGFLATLTKIGFPEAILQRRDINHRLATNVFWINLALTIVLTVAFAASGPLLAKVYHDPRIVRVSAIASLSIIFTGASVVHGALLDRGMCFSAGATNAVVGRLLAAVVAIVLALAGWGYWALVVGVVVQPLALFVGAWLLCRWTPGLPRRTAGTGSLVSFAVHVSGTANVNYWTRNFDNVLVGWRFGPSSLGLYKKAYDLFALPANQLFSMFPVAVSTLSRLVKDPPQYRRYFLSGLSSVAIVGMGAAGAMTLIGRDVVRIILGPKWEAAGWIFTVFAPGIGILLMYKSVTMIHLSLGTTGRLFKWTILEVAVTAPLFFLGLRWGPIGVAAAWTASFCILILPAFKYAGNPIQLEISAVLRSTWRFLAASLLAGCVCALVMRSAGSLADLPGWSGALVRAIVTSLLFGLLYIGSIILVHGGYAPLRTFAGVIQDMIAWKKAPERHPVPAVTEKTGGGEPLPDTSLAENVV
jgi:O-antigen/teichoic acid export membrane protein